MEIGCKICTYVWNARKKNPKACPRCKSRLDRDLIVKRKK